MNRTCFCTAAALIGLHTVQAWAQTPAAPGPDHPVARHRAALDQARTQSARQDQLIKEAMQQVIKQHDIAGMAIAVTDHGSRRFYNDGLASKSTGQAVSNQTLFELGSISKTFTATLATWAQAQGTLALSEPIQTYLPYLQGSRLGQVPVLHLATHTAGGFPLQVPERVQDAEQLKAYFKAWQPQYLPGTHRSYANPSIGLLGVIAAKRLGLPFEQAMEQKLFPALGLSSTYLNVPADQQALYAQGYDRQDAPVRVNPGVLADEAYGVKSSSADLIRFVEAQLQPDAFDKPLQAAIRSTQVGHFTFGPVTQALAWEYYPPPVRLEALLAGNANEMALRTQPATALTPPQAPPTGAWVNKTGSTNGFGGYVAFVPERQLGIVILANRNYPNAERVRLAQQIADILASRQEAEIR
ncbi:beta-lactamase [Pseudomonas syringae]|nr:beta-lactamase [Pseudomonas syringae]MBD8793404.1 beta-lactamase [Pseudomonas syringae]MBD8804006.1 beta-lactamase [Pseudomonas syringae]MBD8812590.1 beta-lactamase [Pseudomonas syringae]